MEKKKEFMAIMPKEIELELRKRKLLTKFKNYMKKYRFSKRTEDYFESRIEWVVSKANKAKTIEEFLDGAFAWELTPEGKDFWENFK